jgi:tetratricopeptide (TPR) repeat protein
MKMKSKYSAFAIFLCAMLFAVTSAFSENKSGIDAAAEAYRLGNFKKSIELYESVVAQYRSQGKESPEIYYNLGNAYFRDGQMAKSILNYERALLLNPGDDDIRHNLQFARTRIEDKIDTSNSLFLTNWYNAVQNIFNSNQWGRIAISAFIIFLLCIAGFLFSRILWLKKTSFYSGIVVFMIMIAANVFAFNQKNARVHRKSGIVMSAAASIKTSPDINSKELFQLHTGSKVKIKGSDGNWYEIQISNGSVGWVPKEFIEII